MSNQEIKNGFKKTEAQKQLCYHSVELQKLTRSNNTNNAKVKYHANCIRKIAQANSVHTKF